MAEPSTKPHAPKAQSGTDRAGGPAASVAGVIRRDELYLASEVCRRLRWQSHAYRQARRSGLRTIRFGRQAYILGDDLLAFFRRLGAEQDEASPERHVDGFAARPQNGNGG